MNSRKDLGQYFTPGWARQEIVDQFYRFTTGDLVCECSCGDAGFLSAIEDNIAAFGVEIDPLHAQTARLNTGRLVIEGDFATVPLPQGITHIISNPPFKLTVIDRFLDRAHDILPEGGEVGFILPAYALQTAERVVNYGKRFSLQTLVIPRNIFADLRLPLTFTRFHKSKKVWAGFALFEQAAAVQRMPRHYRDLLEGSAGSVWLAVAQLAFQRLGGRATLDELYRELENARPTATRWWKEKLRQTVRRYNEIFQPLDRGTYALRSSQAAVPL
ncbi:MULTISPECIES: class I SAM-dependent methyltransferase [Herbaspirillum]|uniref:Class I SAM-dependent methyltransferase n=3 Tax=root TaxID=1 RepID=A0AAJ2H4Z4_9BURK|nr:MULTISPECIES: class I SAM-dependent methyltransferase [Herbaspirillum]MDR9836827.1 class I SAM-dependent methyltransferase [Herbaspirillum huttiense]